MAREINDLEFNITVPKHDNSGNKIKPSEVAPVAKKLSREFGGVSINPSVLGCWENDDDELMCEENMEISTSLDTEDPDSPSRSRAENIVESQAENIGDEFGQWAVMTSQEKTEVEFVEGDFKEEVSAEKHEDVFDRVL